MEELKAIGKETVAENANAKLIGFVETLSGGLISNGLGILTDQVENFRLTQALKLRDKLNEELKTRGLKEPKAIRPKILIPLLENATLEDDDDLQNRYAMLLANACDPNYKGNIQRSFISILRDLEPIDVAVLDYVFKEKYIKKIDPSIGITLEFLQLGLGYTKESLALADGNLVRHGLFRANAGFSAKFSKLTSLAIAFVEATQPSQKQSDSSALDELQSMGQEYEAG